MMIVGTVKQTETALLAGQIVCPGCTATLRP